MVPHVREGATPLRPRNSSDSPGNGVFQQNRPEAVARGAPVRSLKSIEAAVEVAAARRLNVIRLDACFRGRGSRPPAARHCGRPPTPSTSRPPIRHSRPRRPANSTGTSSGSHDRRRATLRDTELARACGRQPARAWPPRRRRSRGSATTRRPRIPIPPESTIDPHRQPHHNQARVIDTPIRYPHT
jgi:hypothetical protein